ncbi:MAG: IS1595 family transposase [Demequinaceae bacterium]|nr:IS1595 family transposase [Demequinaceae bacterium]
MEKQEFSVPKLAARLKTEADAYRFLEELRWGGEPQACPLCGVVGKFYFLKPANGETRRTRTGSRTERRLWKCASCRRQFSVLTNTIFHGTRIPLRTWVLVIFDMCSAKNGVSAWEVSRKYGITNESAWHMLHRIREAMKREPVAGLLRRTVIADETWIGGDPKNRHRSGPRVKPRGPFGGTDKIPVLALVHHETREVRAMSIVDVTGKNLRRQLGRHIDVPNTHLWTDSAGYYRQLAPEFADHEAVNHKAGQYKVRGGATTNAAEGFFSQLKRSLDGTHHHVSLWHLDRYLEQFAWLATNCRKSDSERLRMLINNVDGRRLTYRPIPGVA